ncbi:hypothetical protein [Palleronia caenipelagi]|uniref:hypothetical protein n=1 Tax=Palleronia caenipelagi TaxID=2489174 RepID=UPI00115D7AD5|nr:hypothetical protein [Palleronia caenipelagi]
MTLTLKASDLENLRKVVGDLEAYPDVVRSHIATIAGLFEPTELTADFGTKLAEAVKALQLDNERASTLATMLVPYVRSATISDPAGQKGRLS